LAPRLLRLATILAHPDDETFGVGGTLIRYTSDGAECHSLCLTRGERGNNGRVDAPVAPPGRLGETRASEMAEAGRRMGLASATCLAYPDGGLADVDAEDVMRAIVRWLREVRPDVTIVWGPDGGYGHPDHVAAGERALEAIARAASATFAPELGAAAEVRRCYRTVGSAEDLDLIEQAVPDFAAYIATLPFRPERWTRERLGAAIDIRAVAERKWHAMEAHRTQRRDLDAWTPIRERAALFSREEVYLRAFPNAGGPPLDADLFVGLRA